MVDYTCRIHGILALVKQLSMHFSVSILNFQRGRGGGKGWYLHLCHILWMNLQKLSVKEKWGNKCILLHACIERVWPRVVQGTSSECYFKKLTFPIFPPKLCLSLKIWPEFLN